MLPKSYSSFAKFGVTRSVQLLSSSGFAMSPKNCVTIFEGLLGHGFSVLIRNLFKYLQWRSEEVAGWGGGGGGGLEGAWPLLPF